MKRRLDQWCVTVTISPYLCLLHPVRLIHINPSHTQQSQHTAPDIDKWIASLRAIKDECCCSCVVPNTRLNLGFWSWIYPWNLISTLFDLEFGGVLPCWADDVKTTSVSPWVLKSDLTGCSCLNPAWSCYGLPTLVTPVSNYTPTSANRAESRQRAGWWYESNMVW